MAESCCGGHKLAEKEVGSRNKNAPCWKPPYFTSYGSLNFNNFILTAPILIQFFSGGTYELNSPEKSTLVENLAPWVTARPLCASRSRRKCPCYQPKPLITLTYCTKQQLFFFLEVAKSPIDQKNQS